MIDFHSHVIPHIDDGSKSFEMSLDMLRLAASEGTRYICATSHYIPGEVVPEENLYLENLRNLREMCEVENLDINVLTALELYMHPELPKLYTAKKIWGINSTPYVLVELPMQQYPVYTEEVLYELRMKGAMPIIAHPERNFRIGEDVSLLESLVKQGALAQVNAGSLRGIYGKDIKKVAEKLVDMNLIHMVGSDAHDYRRRTTKVREARHIIKERNAELYKWIIENEENIIHGLSVEVLPVKAKKRFSLFFKLFK